MAGKKQSELTVVIKAKELCSYIMVITQKSPKHFRYTFVSRLQNLSLDIIEHIYRANDIPLMVEDPASYKERLLYQKRAATDIRLLSYFAELSMEQGCILKKQYEQISKMAYETRRFLLLWMESDKKRMGEKTV